MDTLNTTTMSRKAKPRGLSEAEMRAKQTTNEELIADGLGEAINKARQKRLAKEAKAK